MAEPRRLSPRALSMRRRGQLVWGILLIAAWALVTIPVSLSVSGDSAERLGKLLAVQVLCGLPGIGGVALLISGVLGEIKAKRFNVRDWALADALQASLRELWSQPPETAYQTTHGEAFVQSARLIEVERHFDAQTGGAITGTMTHQLRMFGTSFSATYGSAIGDRGFGATTAGSFSGSIRGLSEVNLGVSTTTRDNLLGDALFSVFEAPGPADERDTHRVISMSQPGVMSWINDLVHFAAAQLGGQSTHAGSTVLGWSQSLAARFAPGDISYVTDRLKALHSRPMEEREPVAVRGMIAGRNAIIATSLTLGAGSELRLMPARFPTLFGNSVAVGIANGEHQLTAQQQPGLPHAGIPQAGPDSDG